ncbi:LytR C-terminal domain-containing protein [Actinophytocola sp.]|uniref:LytR C-terminal domain-containing protein n=1 Tax=Actinophytocola sp. TaxID=1872138 RepID=UPI003D6A6B0E
MTAPDPPSPTRPLRVAGLALLGLAAIALVIGLVSIFDGNGDGDDEAGPPPTTANGTGTPGEQPSSPPTSEASPTEPPPTTTGEVPATTTPPGGPSGSPPAPPPGGDGNGEPGKTQPVRVYNNSTIGGLGAEAADDLRAVGWNVVEVGNYPYGTIPTTTVYYRSGTAEQSAANDIADDFGMRVEERFAGIEGFPPGVLVIVTNDYQGIGGKNNGK